VTQTITRTSGVPETLSRDELIERLRAAEDVCLMYGWSATTYERTDRQIAAYELWRKWYALAADYAEPKNHPHLRDRALRPMIREHRERRAQTQKAISRIVVEEPGANPQEEREQP
jgi:hypothetical protein